MNAVRSSSGERLHSPFHGVLHRKCPGNPPTDLVSQDTQIFLEHRRLQCSLDDSVGVVGLGRSWNRCRAGEAEDKTQPQRLRSSHIRCIRNENQEKRKTQSCCGEMTWLC